MDKQYIGREEAYELTIARGFERLPRKGREYVNVPSIAECAIKDITPTALGKDEHGYYVRTVQGLNNESL